MKIFVFEYVTGGGLAGEPLPPSLAREADMMVRALVGELLELPGISVQCSRDPRLPPVPGAEQLLSRPGEGVLALFARGVAGADAVWPTAPETGGVLEMLAVEVLGQHKILLGCRPAAVRVAASKRATARALAAAGVCVAPTFGPSDAITPLPGRWVVKPDDGAGSEGVRRVAGWQEAKEALARGVPGLVAQPWVSGDPGSLSLLCAEDEALLLAANRQFIDVEDDRLLLRGLSVNAITDAGGGLAALAERVVRAIPGLWGYVGVDLILTDSAPVVLEVNPRLTTSYCGLRAALGTNVAATVLDLLDGAPREWLPTARAGATHELTLGAAADD